MDQTTMERDMIDRLYWSVIAMSAALSVGSVVWLSLKWMEM